MNVGIPEGSTETPFDGKSVQAFVLQMETVLEATSTTSSDKAEVSPGPSIFFAS